MAKSTISGLTVTIGADTKKFSNAIKELDKDARNIAKDLKNVSQSLKIDPGDAESYADKMKLLQEAASKATSKVDAIKQAIKKLNQEYNDGKQSSAVYAKAVEEVEQAYKSGKISQDDYKKNLEAIDKTYSKGKLSQEDYEKSLTDLERQLESATYEQNLAVNALDQYQRETSDTARSVDNLGDEQKDTNKELKNTDDAANEAKSGLDKLKDSLHKIFSSDAISKSINILKDGIRTVARLAIQAGKELFNFSKEAVSLAATYDDQMQYSETVFGEFSESAQNWVESNSERLRIYKGDLLTYTNSFGQIFKVQGLAENEALNMTESLIGLSADLRAATGRDTTEINELLQRGFTSSLRNFRSLGVVMSEGAVKAYALEHGLVQTTVDQTKLADATLKVAEAQKKANDALAKYGEDSLEFQRAEVNLTKAEEKLNDVLGGQAENFDAATRSTAIYEMLMESLANIVGQNDKESSLYNSQLELTKTKLKNLKEEIGERLLPTFNNLVTTFNEFLSSEEGKQLIDSIVSQFEKWANTIDEMVKDGTFINFLNDIAEKLPTIVENIGNIVQDVIELTPYLLDGAEALLTFFGIGKEADIARATEEYTKVKDAVESFAQSQGISLDTAKKAVEGFATENNLKVYQVYQDWSTYEPKMAEYIGKYSTSAETAEQDVSTAMAGMSQAIADADNNIGSMETTGMEQFRIKVRDWAHSITGFFTDVVNAAANSNSIGDFFFGNLPGRASGGRVSANTPYLVGDDAQRRPEIFIPDQSGQIVNGDRTERILNNINNSRSVGDVNIYLTSYGADAGSIANEIGNAVQQKLRMSGAMLY